MLAPLVVVLVVASLARADDGAWEAVDQREGIAVERRTAGDPPARELRLTARSEIPPAGVMATLWKHEEYTDFLPWVKHVDIVRDEGDQKVIYEQIRIPVVKDRDATVRITRSFVPETGTYEVASSVISDDGPPEREDHVRVRTGEAQWRLAPGEGGGTQLTYTVRTDLGGRMPGWIFDTVQKDVAMRICRAMLERVRRNYQQAGQ
jgi:ribosome-associated toxin RatA of RatAB toxin-antitoxin module